MAALREVFARFGVQFDSRQLERGATRVNAVTSRLREFGELLVGSMIVRGLGRFVSESIRAATDLDVLSRRLRVSAADLQGWQHAAELSGASADDMAEALSELQVKAYEAVVEGSDDTREHFDRLGVQLTDTSGRIRATSDLMQDFIRGLASTSDATIQLGAADALMSEEGKRLLSFFRQGPEVISRYRSEFERLGGGTSDEFVTRSAEIARNLTRWRLSMLSLRSTIIVAVLPTMNRLVEIFTRLNTILSDTPGVVRVLTGAFVALGVAAAAAALRSIAAWLAAAAPILLVVVAVGLLALAVSELWATWNGGESILRMFINELFPGMVDGLDSTDRAIIAVTEHISRMIEGLTLLGEMAAPLADVIMMPFRPLLAVLGLAVDLGQGRGIADAGQRALGRFTADTFGVFGGRSLVGYNPEEEEMRGRREGGARALADVRRRAGGGVLAREETRTEAMLPTHLRGQRRQQTVTVDVAGNPVEINFHDVGILSPEESARIAKNEVTTALDRHSRSLLAALVPGRSPVVGEFDL